ncbi:DUF4199 domain-containing protein [Pontibacter harenae]|uniref:DUF4199 domain-containing protein n=1 Tax=Pontibacter harenae TaxID=2894083 RepID=UPI001E3F72DD|nr:DUF4199 domain-containing protein [Pontibacter harenae]MCC9167126.1 DUF4199 domain-containing protein [Pontibacter harenae]
MTENQPSVTSPAIKYGFIGGLVSIAYSAVLLVNGVDTNSWMGTLGYIILIVAMVMAMKEFKQSDHGYMSYGQGLGIGTLVSAVFGVLSGLFMFVYATFIDPNFQQNIRDKQILDLESRGYSDEQIEQSMGIAEMFSSPTMLVVLTIVGYIFMGFIIALIVSAIMKNKRPEFE